MSKTGKSRIKALNSRVRVPGLIGISSPMSKVTTGCSLRLCFLIAKMGTLITFLHVGRMRCSVSSSQHRQSMHVSYQCCGWSFGEGLASRYPFLPLGLDYEDSYFCRIEESWGLFPDLIPIPGWSSLMTSSSLSGRRGCRWLLPWVLGDLSQDSLVPTLSQRSLKVTCLQLSLLLFSR